MRGPRLRLSLSGCLSRVARGWRWLGMWRMSAVGRLIVLLCALLPGACGCAHWAGLALAEGPPSVWPPAHAAGLAFFPALELFPAPGFVVCPPPDWAEVHTFAPGPVLSPSPAARPVPPVAPAAFAGLGRGISPFGGPHSGRLAADAGEGAVAAGSCGWRLRFGCTEAAQ